MNQNKSNPSLDNLIAQLNLMTTDFIFSRHQCIHRTIAIAKQLQKICDHSELAFFPEQQLIYFKMLKVWKTLAYEIAPSKQKHSAHNAEKSRPQAIH